MPLPSNFKLDSKGNQEERQHGRRRLLQKTQFRAGKSMEHDFFQERARELATDLFGDDANEPDAPEISHPAPNPQMSVQTKKKVKQKKDGSKATKKQMIPDDPFDIHGIENKEERKAAWVDQDDININESLKRKAQEKHGSSEVFKKQYSQTLTERFIKLNEDTPDWADLNRLEEEEEGILARSTGNYLSSTSGDRLPKGTLLSTPVTALNKAYLYKELTIVKVLEFSKHLPVAMVAGSSGTIRGSATLFKVDGKDNQMIQTFKLPGFLVMCAKFLHDGRRCAMGSSYHKYMIVHDMESGHNTKVKCSHGHTKGNSKTFVVSPDGSLMVFLGKAGQLHLYDARALAYIDTLYAPGMINAATFNDSGTKLYTYGEGGDVFVWDMNARQCVHRFYDDGCIEGSSITMSSRHLVCGSFSGVVNVYDTSTLISSPSPTPVKVLSRLVNPIKFMAFNHTAEILVTASSEAEQAFKLIHFPSMTYFENVLPGNSTFNRVQTASFSPRSGYLAIGNNMSKAFLYRLDHYSQY